jgi:hypothetical protein
MLPAAVPARQHVTHVFTTFEYLDLRGLSSKILEAKKEVVFVTSFTSITGLLESALV